MDERHSRDDLWKQITDQSNQISEVRSGQAATDARLGALESAVDSGFRSLSSEIQRHSQPTNYVGLIVLALGLLGMFGGYALLITTPMREDIQENYELLIDRQSYGERIASLEATIKLLTVEVSEQREWQRDASFIHGQREELGKRVEDIDNQGSRRWNTGSEPEADD